jgi:hypothetical protein
MAHYSDCAVHNEPAYPAGPCDCGGLDLAENAGELLGAPLVPMARGLGLDVCQCRACSLVEDQKLPADPLIAFASAADLPDRNNVMVEGVCPDRVNLNEPRVAIIVQGETEALL